MCHARRRKTCSDAQRGYRMEDIAGYYALTQRVFGWLAPWYDAMRREVYRE